MAYKLGYALDDQEFYSGWGRLFRNTVVMVLLSIIVQTRAGKRQQGFAAIE